MVVGLGRTFSNHQGSCLEKPRNTDCFGEVCIGAMQG